MSDFQARLLVSLVFLRYIQQHKLRFPAFKQHGVAFPFVVAECDVLLIDVAVACLQLTNQLAFGYLVTPQKPIRTDILSKRGKE